jgi:hypothetical protein
MIDFIFPVSFAVFAIFFLILSSSKKNYQKMVDNNDEEFAKKVNKALKICGYLLLVLSIFWMVFISFL